MSEEMKYYMQYIEALDEGNFEVSDWEAGFLESLIENPPRFLTSKQHAILHRMVERYLDEDLR